MTLNTVIITIVVTEFLARLFRRLNLFTRSTFAFGTLFLAFAVFAPVCSAQSGSRNSAPRTASPAPSPNFSQGQTGASNAPSFGTEIPVPGGSNFGNAPMTDLGATSVPNNLHPTISVASDGSSLGDPAMDASDDIWAIYDQNSTYSVDHSFFDYFLSRYVVTDRNGLNRVCYASVSSSDRSGLCGYLNELQSVDVRTLNRDEQLAYWLNLYNARVLAVILEHYPVRSIRQIKSKFLDLLGPFDDELICVLGEKLTLNDVESGIIRPIWKDPRVHYALNCASYGCPNLRKQAWRAENLSADLDRAAYQFINSNRSVRVGPFGFFVRVSKIYKWYAEDFGGSDEAVLRHLCRYANAKTRRKLRRAKTINSYFYDWSLNDAKRVRNAFLERFIR